MNKKNISRNSVDKLPKKDLRLTSPKKGTSKILANLAYSPGFSH
jgi:predicted  nucleic acid-binding Zn-ribbon protein